MAFGIEFFSHFAKKITVYTFRAKCEIGRKNSDGMAVEKRANCRAAGGFLKIPYACRFVWPQV